MEPDQTSRRPPTGPEPASEPGSTAEGRLSEEDDSTVSVTQIMEFGKGLGSREEELSPDQQNFERIEQDYNDIFKKSPGDNGQSEDVARTSEDDGNSKEPGELATPHSTEDEARDKVPPENPNPRGRALRRDVTFVTARSPKTMTQFDINTQSAAISSIISQQHDNLFEQTQRTKELIAAVRRNIKHSIQSKRQEALLRQNRVLPVARQHMKISSVMINDFGKDLPTQKQRIFLPSKRKGRKWRHKLPPLDHKANNINKTVFPND